MAAPYSVFTRIDKKTGKPYFCVKFFHADGTPKKSSSLRDCKTRTAAVREAEKMLREGVSAENPDVLEYVRAFWTRESDYVRGRALRGVVISDHYLKDNLCAVSVHLAAHLKGRRMLDMNQATMERIILDVSKTAGPRRVNVALQALRVPYGYFCRMKKIANQLAAVEKLAEKPKARGILTAAEIGAIIALKNESPRVVAAVLLGALCGLRRGEIRGLQAEDVDDAGGIIHIRHNIITEDEGLKAPKWESARDVPAPEPVRDALRVCLALAPKKSAYVIFNERTPTAPIPTRTIADGFHRILKRIGIGDAERKRRNICFHGLRHTFVSLSRAGGVPDFIVQRMAGHSSMDMTEKYSHADGVVDFAAARAALEKAVKPKEGEGAKAGGA